MLAAAGSAVGLGNIWRFPYLAAKDGGGLFLVIYLILALTFGFTLLTTEIAIGRKTKQSPLTAYGKLKEKWGFLGILACLVPVIIMPYYSAIGGWVVKYLLAYLTGQGSSASADGYFTGYITGTAEPLIFMIAFLLVVAVIIYRGVNHGIESFSKVLMPLLLLMVVGISAFSLTIHATDESGVTRTGLEGFWIYVIPSFEGLTVKGFFTVLLDAMGQLFFSLSVAMGIMIAYGSYVKDDANLVKSINQIEIFDTAVAFLAGVMIIPAVYTFMGQAGMEASGPSLMFVSLPKVFSSMGRVGNLIGAKMEELAAMRRSKQPLEFPSAGSTFKRPEGYYAGKLIMEAGMRGYRIGGAQVSEKHCGFIVNTGNATATDIREVIEEVQERVEERFHVSLEPEIIFLGDF